MAVHYGLLDGLSESYLADIGRIIAAWSHIEMQFDFLFLSLVVMRGASSGSMSNPRVKLLGQTFDRRLGDFRTRLGELELSPKTIASAEKILSQLDTLRKERDEVAHGQWNPNIDSSDQAVKLFKSWKNTKPHEFTAVSQKRLKEIFGRMQVLCSDLLLLSLHPGIIGQKPRPASL